MDVKSTFNIILLSLSLTTLLITIISYIIFRLRYSIQKKHDKDLHHLEGVFFLRYAPHLKRLNDDFKNKLESKVGKREFWRTRPALLFLFVGIIIAAVFISEGYLLFNKELKNRQNISSTYRELLGMGLLKVNKFDSSFKINSQENFSESFKKRERILFDLLKSMKVVLISPIEIKDNQLHQAAMSSWSLWLQKFKVEMRTLPHCDEILSDELVIFPAHPQSESTKSCLEKLLSRKLPVIFTGPLAPNIIAQKLGLTITHQPDSQQTGSAIFKNSFMLGDTPPGLRLDWQPIDRSYHYEAPKDKTLAYYYQGQGLAEFNKPQSLMVYDDNILWLAMDPVSGIDLEIYLNQIFANLLVNIKKIPHARVHLWPNGVQQVSAIAIDSEDKLDNLPKIIKIIKKYNYPVTAFFVSNLLKVSESILDSFDQNDELASHTDDHQNLGERTIEYDFHRLQNSRIDIEELHKKEVIGFRPPEEFYDEISLSAIIQSGFKYMFADQKNFRLTPYFINNGQFVMIPRILDDDYIIKRNKLLDSPEKYRDHLLAQYNIVSELGGPHLLSLHTNFLGDDPLMLEGFSFFLEEVNKYPNHQKLTYKQIIDWWMKRDQVVAWVDQESGNQRVLRVENQGATPIEQVVVEVTDEVQGPRQIIVPKIEAGKIYSLELEGH